MVVSVDKSPDLRVIIPALQVIEARVGIVVVAPVAQRILDGGMAGGGDCAAIGVLDGEEFSPRVIFIGCDQPASRPRLRLLVT